MIAQRLTHHREDERRGVRELHVVAGVEPPALRVVRSPVGTRSWTRNPLWYSGVSYDLRVRVVEVRGLAVQHGRVDVGPVALRQEVEERVVQQRGVQIRPGPHPERRGRGAGGLQDVDAGVVERVEVDLVHVRRSGSFHGAAVRADRAGEDHDVAVPDQLERLALVIRGGKEERLLRPVLHVARPG